MFILANLLVALAGVLDITLTVLYWLILIRALISWVSPDPFNPVVEFLYKATEPILYPIRRILPPGFKFGIDLSPLLAFMAIIFIKSFLIKTLMDFSFKIKGA